MKLITTRHIAAATVGTVCLALTTLAAAADVTYVLNNGERHTGQLVYHTGTNIGLIQNGNERTFPVSDVAVIIYNDGDPRPSEIRQLPTSDNPPELERHTLVMRDGRVLHGKVYHWNPGDVVFDTTSGRATYNANDVARLYLSGPPARRLFGSEESSLQAPGNNGRGRGFGRGRMGRAQTTVQIPANQRWTDTGIVVQAGERIAFSASGSIEFGKGMTTGPDGDRNFGSRPGYVTQEVGVGGLIGRVGNSAPFAIGSTSTPITMPVGGRLFLGVNDDGYSDNSGAYEVAVYRR
jgi:hypothetical protein